MLQIAETNTETGAASAQAIRPRNRAGTERAIFIAARTLLAEEGFQGFGVNAVARRAGCDKQLIYRYYGGLNGLIDAILPISATGSRIAFPKIPAACFF